MESVVSKRKKNLTNLPLPQSFFQRDTELVAQDLLSKKLIRVMNGVRLSGLIVETEAYTSDDPACHAFRGKTAANSALFGPVGHAYVYFTYGMHFCFNVVARATTQDAGGVLIRAIEPLEGIEIMKKNRSLDALHQLTNGPAKLAQAFAIDKRLTGHNLMCKNELYLVDVGIHISKQQVVASPRIGISKACSVQRRFYIKNNSWVSK